jgi:shikimate kinase
VPIIWLIGFRGTGKTTVGRRLAAVTGLQFMDTDRVIEELERMTIADIFQKRGEMHFRIAEQQAILQLAVKNNLVVSVGGGACAREANVIAMRRSGTVVLLTADREEIERRLREDQATVHQRPPLTDRPTMREEIDYLLEQRDADYRRAAHVVIDTSLMSVDDVVNAIMKEIRRHR